MTPQERAAEIVRQIDQAGLSAASAADAPAIATLIARVIQAAIDEALLPYRSNIEGGPITVGPRERTPPLTWDSERRLWVQTIPAGQTEAQP